MRQCDCCYFTCLSLRGVWGILWNHPFFAFSRLLLFLVTNMFIAYTCVSEFQFALSLKTHMSLQLFHLFFDYCATLNDKMIIQIGGTWKHWRICLFQVLYHVDFVWWVLILPLFEIILYLFLDFVSPVLFIKASTNVCSVCFVILHHILASPSRSPFTSRISFISLRFSVG